MSRIKKMVQAPIIYKKTKDYRALVKEQRVPYDTWIRRKEDEERKEKSFLPSGMTVKTISYDACRASFSLMDYAEDIVLFVRDVEALDQEAAAFAASFFEADPSAVIAYADEDEWNEAEGIREKPWLKPAWSPDTLFSHFYFGDIFAVRRKSVLDIVWENSDDEWINLYDFCLKVTEKHGAALHMDRILYHGRELTVTGYEDKYDGIRKNAAGRRGWDKKENALVSVVIPSKDNPRVLASCIHSVLNMTDYPNVEIIVIDNGSSPANKERIERIRSQIAKEWQFTYHYAPMEFNFPAMCNLGARMARGKYILLLNDDIEIIETDWLDKMVEKASLPHVGAVGVKLLYPGSKKIQHAGITNIHLGPAHKLQFLSDEFSYYFGRNRLVFNMIGSTAACLLVRKSVYEEAGGLNEEMRVAFNDVEFCFHLHQLGYYNVQRNDVICYHHESLSRGLDETLDKRKRLHREMDMLYELYPRIYNNDPFYHRYLVSDILDNEYHCENRYDSRMKMQQVRPVRWSETILPEWHNECLAMGVEFAGDMSKWETGSPGWGDYYLQGWAFIFHVDNARYHRSLLLRKLASDESRQTDEIYQLPYTPTHRPDQEEHLPFIVNAALEGLSIVVDRDALPGGIYEIGFLMEDCCSRQKMCRFTAETLVVSAPGL